MTPKPIAALAKGTRVPTPFTDEDGIPCLRVPLDDQGEDFAIIEHEDYDHITQTLGLRASWFLSGSRGQRRYVQFNAPKVGGKGGGVFQVVRLFPGVEMERAEYATSDTQDLRRRNLRYRAGDERTRRNLIGLLGHLMERRKSPGKP